MKSNTKSGGDNLSIPAKARLTRELSLLSNDPPPGIACYVVNESNMSLLRAQITIRKNSNDTSSSCYTGGIFMVSIQIPCRYPFEPPHVRFVTSIYHPNIDAAGRICLDTLKSPPAGTWSPAVSLPSLLLTLQTLLCEPNPDDALMADIANQYKRNYTQFCNEARKRTQLYATAEAYTTLEQTLDNTNNHTTTTTTNDNDETNNNNNNNHKDQEKESSVENKRLKPSSDHETDSTPKRKLLRTE